MNGRYFLAVTFEKRVSPSRLQTSEKFLKIKIKKFLKESYRSNVLLRDVAERGYVAALSSVALLLCPFIYFFWGTSWALGGGTQLWAWHRPLWWARGHRTALRVFPGMEGA